MLHWTLPTPDASLPTLDASHRGRSLNAVVGFPGATQDRLSLDQTSGTLPKSHKKQPSPSPYNFLVHATGLFELGHVVQLLGFGTLFTFFLHSSSFLVLTLLLFLSGHGGASRRTRPRTPSLPVQLDPMESAQCRSRKGPTPSYVQLETTGSTRFVLG